VRKNREIMENKLRMSIKSNVQMDSSNKYVIDLSVNKKEEFSQTKSSFLPKNKLPISNYL
jgi:hypothetical protein